MSILTAYFSASGITAAKAKAVSEALGTALYEIKPATPYTEADVNWRKPLARCNKEWLKKAAIDLADNDAPVAESDTVLLFFPIWYYTAPLIIRSFMRAYDFSGKKVILFATSGGSAFGKAAQQLGECAPGAEIKEGALLNGIDGDALKAEVEKYL